jgi:hypothetical protein
VLWSNRKKRREAETETVLAHARWTRWTHVGRRDRGDRTVNIARLGVGQLFRAVSPGLGVNRGFPSVHHMHTLLWMRLQASSTLTVLAWLNITSALLSRRIVFITSQLCFV